MANTVRMKRSAVQGKAPVVGDLALGELAVNTYDGKLYMKKNDGSDAIVEIGAGGTTVSATAPSSPSTGDLWYDTEDARTFVWTGTEWVDAAPDSGYAVATTSDTAPANANDGDLWYRSSDGRLYIYYDDGNTSQWVDANPNLPIGAVASDTPPANANDGDLWYRTSDGRMYVYYNDGNTSQWVDANPNLPIGAVASDTAPSNPNDGDLWYRTTDARMYVYYNDGNTSQWVDTNPDTSSTIESFERSGTTVSLVNSGDTVSLDGDLTVAGDVKSTSTGFSFFAGSSTSSSANFSYLTPGQVNVNRTDNTSPALVLSLSGTANTSLNADGSALFAGRITSDTGFTAGGNPNGGTADGGRVDATGTALFSRTTGNSLIRGYTTGSSTATVDILADGSATFAGDGIFRSTLSVTGSTGNGLYVGDSSEIVLTKDGNATFAGYVESDLFSVSRSAVANKDNYTSKLSTADTGKHFKAVDTGANTVASINADGSATFTATVRSGGDPNDGGAVGTKMTATGIVQATRSSGASAVFTGYTQGTTTPTTRIDADGDATFAGSVGIGVSTAADTLHVRGPSSGTILNLDRAGSYSWKLGQTPSSTLTITGDTTERMQITPAGFTKFKSGASSYFGGSGEYHEFITDSNNWTIICENEGSSVPYGILVKYSATTPNSTSSQFFTGSDSTGDKIQLRSNGGIANYQSNDANLCDEREKKNIETLDSTWSCLKNWELKKFHYNEDADIDDKRYGVIAQQVEQHCPEVITDWTKQRAEEAVLDEDGNVVTPAKEEILRKGVKEQQMMWMAIKALQEAQDRIEALETQNADLVARIEALEQV